MLLSYKFRLYPNKVQTIALGEMLRDFCALYNAGLQQRVEAWRRNSIAITYGMQANEIKACRADGADLSRWSFSAEQQVLRRLDKAFKAFFSRLKRGEKPGFPRFRSTARYHAADFRVGDGLTIRKSGKIGILGVVGEIKVKWHRSLAGSAKSAILSRQNEKWYIVFHVEIDRAESASRDSIGIDVGLTSLVALSNGETLRRPNFTKKSAKGLRRRQRQLSRCKLGSKRRSKAKARVARFYRKISATRRDALHKITRNIAGRFSDIAVEELNIKGLSKSILAKDVRDASWANLIAMLDYKAAKAGGRLIKVDPRETSQTCPKCGTIKAKALSERRHRCECGCDLDRDVAAAMVIHFRAFGFWPGHGHRNISEPNAAQLFRKASAFSAEELSRSFTKPIEP